jgi:hypothetical protein
MVSVIDVSMLEQRGHRMAVAKGTASLRRSLTRSIRTVSSPRRAIWDRHMRKAGDRRAPRRPCISATLEYPRADVPVWSADHDARHALRRVLRVVVLASSVELLLYGVLGRSAQLSDFYRFPATFVAVLALLSAAGRLRGRSGRDRRVTDRRRLP